MESVNGHDSKIAISGKHGKILGCFSKTGTSWALCALLCIAATCHAFAANRSVTPEGVGNAVGAASSKSSFLGGSGTSDDPYLIGDIHALQAVNGDLTAHYRLVSDIDALVTFGWNQVPGSIFDYLGFLPIGGTTGFSGVLDGNGYTVSTLCIKRETENYVGLFSRVNSDGRIENLNLNAVSIKGNSRVGGLAGQMDGTVSYCHVMGTINGSGVAGGIAGGSGGTIRQSSMSGIVSITNAIAGGIAGYASGLIVQCFTYGRVYGSDSVGGIAGRLDGHIENSLAHNNVRSVQFIFGGSLGGIVGDLDGGSLQSCLSTGLIALPAGARIEMWNTFGFTSTIRANSTLENSFFDTTVNPGISAGNNEGIFYCYGKTTNALWTIGTYTSQLEAAGGTAWDFETVWGIKEGLGYPYLKMTAPVPVEGEGEGDGGNESRPTLVLNGDKIVVIDIGATYLDAGATANDVQDGDISSAIVCDNPVNTSVSSIYTLRYNVVDSEGNPAKEAIRTVIVRDFSVPVITLTGPTEVVTECPESYTDAGATASDTLDGTLTSKIVVVNHCLYSTWKGDFDINLYVSDAAGNLGTAARTLTVQDTQPPAIALNGAGEVTVACGSTYTELGATATDACQGNISTVTVTGEPDMSSPGLYAVRYDACDNEGNSDQAVRNVLVADMDPPAIALIGDDHLYLEWNSAYQEQGATVQDSCDGDLSGNLTIAGNVDTSVIGDYTVTYNAVDDAGNSAMEVIRTVTVGHYIPPVITLLGSSEVDLLCNETYVEASATALDDRDGDLSASIQVESQLPEPLEAGAYLITYSVQDSDGNTGVATRTVHVDSIIPEITLIGSQSLILECGETWTDPGAAAPVSCEGDLTSMIVTTGVVDPKTAGTYTVVYRLTYSEGNTVTKERTVEVRDTQPPAIAMNGASDVRLECSTVYTDPGATAVDACDGELGTVAPVSAPTMSTPGDYTVRYAVSDAAGNTAQTDRTVTVEDTNAPAITLIGGEHIYVFILDSFDDPGVTALDACSGDITSSVVASGTVDTAALGDYPIHYSVADASGNTAETVRTVSVVNDRTPPIIKIIGANPQTVECGMPYVERGFSATDNTDGDITGRVEVTCLFPSPVIPGNASVQYRVADHSGNTALVERQVIFVDTHGPSIALIGPDIVHLGCGDAWVEPGVTAVDACEGDVSGSVIINGTVTPEKAGIYGLTYFAHDSLWHTSKQLIRIIIVAGPSVTLTGAEDMHWNCCDAWIEPGATAQDVCGNDISDSIVVSGAIAPKTPGVFVLSYTARDALGNVSEPVTRTVTVYDNCGLDCTEFVEGQGTREDPYLLSTLRQMQCIRGLYLDMHFALKNDIDASETAAMPNGFQPIGPDNTTDDSEYNGVFFNGSFDGRGYTVYDLYINRPQQVDVGLFGFIGETAEIFNLNLERAEVHGTMMAGLLVGDSFGSIHDCSVAGTVTGQEYVGGLGGDLEGRTERCQVNATVECTKGPGGGVAGVMTQNAQLLNTVSECAIQGHGYTGGIAGYSSGVIARCEVKGGPVYSADDAGGVVGRTYGGAILETIVRANVSAEYWALGAVATMIGGTINRVTIQGNISSAKYAAGIACAWYNYAVISDVRIAQSAISGLHVFPFVDSASTSGIVQNSFFAGTLSGKAETKSSGEKKYIRYIQCFYDSERNPVGLIPENDPNYTGIGILPVASSSLKQRAVFTTDLVAAGGTSWDFDYSWTINEGVSMPFFLSFDPSVYFSAGSGTGDDPYIIASPEALQAMERMPYAHYRLGADIDATATSLWNGGNGFRPVGPFFGTLDGDGFIVSNLVIHWPSYNWVGLMDAIENGSVIENIALRNVDIQGGGGAGALVGHAYWQYYLPMTSLIQNCSVSGTISSPSAAGGLIGDFKGDIRRCSMEGTVSAGTAGGIAASGTGTVEECLNLADITGINTAGGIVGYGGTISNCCSRGNVTGGTFVGGICGVQGTIRQSFSSGNLNRGKGSGYFGGLLGGDLYCSTSDINVFDSFFLNLAGMSVVGNCSYVEHSRPAAYSEMIHESLYTTDLAAQGGVPWDFANVWEIQEGQMLPRLRCFIHEEPQGATLDADQDGDYRISLPELLRVVQFFNMQGYSCDIADGGSPDGYLPGPGADQYCKRHSSDYITPAWVINLQELLRSIQFFNIGGYHACPDQSTEDGFCAGM